MQVQIESSWSFISFMSLIELEFIVSVLFQCVVMSSFFKKLCSFICYEIQSFYLKKKKKFKNLNEVLPLDDEKLN